MQVVRPHYKSLFKSLRHDLQLTCLVLTVAIYSCSLAVIMWPTSESEGCRRVTSRNGGTERLPWTGRSFDDKDSSSSSSSSRHVTRGIMTSVQVQKCQQISGAGDVISTVTLTWCCSHLDDVITLTWCSLILVVYLVYVVECWFSPYRRHFSNVRRRVVDTQAAYDLVTSLRNSFPVVRWTAVSYHYIRSTVASVGSASTPLRRHHKSYRQRVVTHRDATMYHYATDDVLDCSAPLVDLEAFPVTWLRISCQFSFGSTAARRDFARQRDAFYRANATRDQRVDFRQTFSLLATSGGDIAWSRDTAVYNPDVRPWYTSVAVYWLASLLTLSWPLRVIIQWRTSTVDYTVHKVFDCRAVPHDNSDDVSMTSVENTTSSSNNRTVSSNSISSDSGSVLDDTNCCLVPSYSQAILMDNRTSGDHKTGNRHYEAQQQQQQQSWRRGHYSVRLRRVQSCASVHRRFAADVKPSTSLTTHLYKSAARHDRVAAAILMTSRPPSYDTAMCNAGHVTAH